MSLLISTLARMKCLRKSEVRSPEFCAASEWEEKGETCDAYVTHPVLENTLDLLKSKMM